MGKLFVLFVALFSLSVGGAQNLPLPLPDDPYPGEPYPVPPPPPKQEVLYSLGSGATPRFGSQTYDFYPRADLNRLVRIRLVGSKNNIEIKEVRILYADYGDERSDSRLAGELKSGGIKEVVTNGRPVYRIAVTASSSYFWKKSGSYRVDVTAQR